MDGGEQTLEKHNADEYEQIGITRERRAGPGARRARPANFLTLFLLPPPGNEFNIELLAAHLIRGTSRPS